MALAISLLGLCIRSTTCGAGHFSPYAAVQCDLTSACQGHCVGIQEVKHAFVRAPCCLGHIPSSNGIHTEMFSNLIMLSTFLACSVLWLWVTSSPTGSSVPGELWETCTTFPPAQTRQQRGLSVLMANRCLHLIQNPNPKRFAIFAFMICWLGIRTVGSFVVWQGFKPVI